MYKAVKNSVRKLENYVILQLIVEPNLELVTREGDVSLASSNQVYYGSSESP
ncbi:hypothetical protein WN55_07038 [Dufourea novaeangliae]|uniref:Uncharacterized protein n=1 Tax=Dufourea novaeangliae TaxID=178035 RepID=A0A154PRS4_DUFNO|nr:hypothetical protein WN55_07038 [Dufourea novaeangliae]